MKKMRKRNNLLQNKSAHIDLNSLQDQIKKNQSLFLSSLALVKGMFGILFIFN